VGVTTYDYPLSLFSFLLYKLDIISARNRWMRKAQYRTSWRSFGKIMPSSGRRVAEDDDNYDDYFFFLFIRRGDAVVTITFQISCVN
jgi:hypothetical protein